jgi:hypothetical protein
MTVASSVQQARSAYLHVMYVTVCLIATTIQTKKPVVARRTGFAVTAVNVSDHVNDVTVTMTA